VIGFIDIGRDRNPDLMDQTNREGLIHNQALDDLRRLANFVLQSIEAERQSVRHPARGALKTTESRSGEAESIPGKLEKLAGKTDKDTGVELRNIKVRLQEQSLSDAADRKRMIEGYSGLAAIGQLTAGLLPVIPHDIKHIRDELQRIKDVLSNRKMPEIRESLAGLGASLDSIDDTLRLITAATGSNERRRSIDVAGETRSYRRLVARLLAAEGVELDLSIQEDEVLRTEMRPENYLSLLQILTSNSLDWMKGVDSPKIKLSLRGVADRCKLLYSDNGPGVPHELAEKIFEPLFSRKEGGRGMGLTIARQLVEAHGGRLALITDARRRGANFLITLTRKRARATGYE